MKVLQMLYIGLQIGQILMKSNKEAIEKAEEIEKSDGLLRLPPFQFLKCLLELALA